MAVQLGFDSTYYDREADLLVIENCIVIPMAVAAIYLAICACLALGPNRMIEGCSDEAILGNGHA